MANDDKPSGFLSRWSRRKVDVREGRALEEPTLAPVVADMPTPTPLLVQDVPNTQTPVPTLADVQQLTPESDYTGFMARGVTPDVKNAAMKKLFTDPHFNVMDRMDIYIDDYSQPDPLPLAMLRQMTSAKTLNLFDDAPEETLATHVGDNPVSEDVKVVAQSASTENNFNTGPPTHDHADLRLQPDPTARPEGSEPEPV
jgi:hypothetical protein